VEVDRARKVKPYKGIAMEGMIATWYAKNTTKSPAEFSSLAERIAPRLRSGASVLGIAPGPGQLAIELARLGTYRITGVDISRSFVRIAAENAARAGVEVDFRQGDAAALPFSEDTFDFIVCRAAFKNFGDPLGALREMHRVLKPGGRALIIDMRADASNRSVSDHVAKMHLGVLDAFLTKVILLSLRRRAYRREDFERMLLETPFGRGEIATEPLGLEVQLSK
jgi:ubiquinone/menaquinone biosynthesis C-methylase UbiE